MNTKNVSLAAFAVVLAAGSAFASFLAPEDVWVKVKLATDPEGPTRCVNTEVQCDATGTAACTVIVPVTGGTQTASTLTTFKPYRGTNCQIILTGTNDFPGGQSDIENIDRLVP